MYDDINACETISCPYCKKILYLNYYEEHLAMCISTIKKISCEICSIIIENDEHDEAYIEHLLSFHNLIEIKNQIKNKKILNILAIPEENEEVQEEEEEITSVPGLNQINMVNNNQNNFSGTNNSIFQTTFINNNFNSFPKPSNVLNSPSNNSHYQKVLVNSTYNITNCKLCSNILIDQTNYLISHLENFHNSFDVPEYVTKSVFGKSFQFIAIQKYCVCSICGVFVEDIKIVLDNHKKAYHKIEIKEEVIGSQVSLPKSVFASNSNIFLNNNQGNVSTPDLNPFSTLNNPFVKTGYSNINPNFSNNIPNNWNLNTINSNPFKNSENQFSNNITNLSQTLYCHFCEIQLSNQQEHIHSSFINLNKNTPNELLYALFDEESMQIIPNSKNKIKQNPSGLSFSQIIKNNAKEVNKNIQNKKTKIEQNLGLNKNSLIASKNYYNFLNNPIHNFNNAINDSNKTIIDKNIKNQVNSVPIAIDEEYDNKFKSTFKPKIFEYTKILHNKNVTHYFSTKKLGSTANILKRLNTEFDKLKEDLPCSYYSSFFVRADENYPQLIKLLIAGSKGTPYEHGLFEFDIYIPTNYPNEPPMCNLVTTGGGKIRFNPNLYSCGKVCLSLLGTWAGSSQENWDPKTSNLLQLILSISSLVMTEQVIINEPGRENMMLTEKGILENEGYCNIIKYGNLNYAMINNVKSPCAIFKDLITDYFIFKEKEIIEDITKWIERSKSAKCSYTGIVNQNSLMCDIFKKSSFEVLIRKVLDELKVTLNNLKSSI